MKKKVAMLLDHPGHSDSRVAGEAAILSDAGYSVKVFCLNTKKSAPNFIIRDVEYVQCFDDKSRTVPYISKASHTLKALLKKETKPPGSTVPAAPKDIGTISRFKRMIGLAFSFQQNYRTVRSPVKAFNPDIIHAHDLTMLRAGVCLARLTGAKLIYDSHEYERSRNGKIFFVEQKIRMLSERRNIRKAKGVITVSDSIADALTSRYRITRPFVYLNNASRARSVATRTRRDYNLPEDKLIGIYTGLINAGRGIDALIEALSLTADIHVAVLGSASPWYLADLQNKSKSLAVDSRIHFLPPVPETETVELMRLCDFAWIPIQNTCDSYNFSLPNKLFQGLAAELPVFATPLLEISRFINHFNLGSVSDGFDGASQAEGLQVFIKQLKLDRRFLKNSADLAAYSRDTMRKSFLEYYQDLITGRQRSPELPLPHMQSSR